MSDTENKKLSELRVVDLRAELEKRGLDKNGVKKDLVERLQKALQSEGCDPETYSFKLGDKPNKRLSTSSSSCQGDDNVPEKVDCELDKSKIIAADLNNAAKESEQAEPVQNEKQNEDDETTQRTQETDLKTKTSEDKPTSEAKEDETGDTSGTQQEPETINLTLEEEENINDENVETEETSGEKTDLASDEKTSPKPIEGSKESPTSASPQETAKRNEDAEQGTSTSNGTNEEANPKKAQSNPKILWITNVPKNTRANELKQLLSSCGKVVCAKVVVNARFPGSCCFGYITMGTAEDATNVITKLNNTEFNGQIIKIDKFENIKADNLKKSGEEKKEDRREDPKNKKGPDDKDKTEQGTKHDDREKREKQQSPERRKSTSDRSSRSRRRSPSRERRRDREHPIHRSGSRGSHHVNVLTFDKIKQERERQRIRERERAAREESRRRHEEAIRLREMREITRRQRSEAQRLEREREMLRIERDKIEREKSELIKLERERQKLEREKIEMEKIELQRSRMRLEEDRRAAKRPLPTAYRREDAFDERKRPTNDRHYEEGPRFEPPPHPSHNPVASKKFPPPKDFKRSSYDKSETFSDKRGRDYNADRSNPTNSQGSNYDRYDDMRGRNSREVTSQSNSVMRGKDSRYPERERSPHFRAMPENRDRHVPSQIKPDREHHYSETNASGRYHPVAPQSKFTSSTPKPWAKQGGGTWRSDPPTGWVSSSNSSGRSPMGQQFSGNSNLPPSVCSPPPPPGIGNFSSERYSGIRKY